MNHFAAFVTVFLLLLAPVSPGASIVEVGVDETTNDAWRTTSVAKPFGDADNVYGSDGYLIAQYAEGDPKNLSQPPYASIERVPGSSYEGAGAESHQSLFDDVVEPGPGPIPDLVAGDYYVENATHLAEDEFFTITLVEDASFRLGVITDQTPDNPPGLLYESSSGVRVTGPEGLDSGLVDVLPMKNADVDYVLFDISGQAGDVFVVSGQNWFPSPAPNGWDANALGGVFLDPVTNPEAPQIITFSTDPAEITALGESINFSWEVETPFSSLLLQPGDIDVSDQTNGAGQGSFTLSAGPDETTVYRLEATRGGETSSATTRVVLRSPEIVSFSSDRAVVSPGTEVTLAWQVAPPVTELVLQPGDLDLLGLTDTNGRGSLTLVPVASTNFELIATLGPSASSLAEALVQVRQPGQGIIVVGVDQETNDAWRTSDVLKPYGDLDNIYGTDGYLIAQYPDGDPLNMSSPSYANVELAAGLSYEGQGAEAHQSLFDDVAQPGPGPIPDLVCGDYWLEVGGPGSGTTGETRDFFSITLTEDASFRLGVITDCTPNNPNGLLFESSVGVQVVGPNGVDSGIVDAVGPDEEWRNADVDYVLFDIRGSAGDVFTVRGVHDERWEASALGGVFFDPSGGPVGPRLTEVSQGGGMLTLKWESEGGMRYNLRSSADETEISSVAPSEWPVWNDFQNLPATPAENTLTIPLPEDSTRFFVVEEFPAPPETVYFANFDDGPAGWISGSIGDLGTLWEIGTPSGVGPSGAFSAPSCFGTNIAEVTTQNIVIFLRSPVIDLTTAGSATLNFQQFLDIEPPSGQQFFDWGTISVLSAGDDSVLAIVQDNITGFSDEWEGYSRKLPEAALGNEIRLEFQFRSDEVDFVPAAGWYIDDVEVTVP